MCSQRSSDPDPGPPEMIPYGTAAEAEVVLGRAMTWAEAAWFRYSATMPDWLLLWHNIAVFFIVYLLAPLPLLLFEQLAPAVALRYKLQPWVRPKSPVAMLRYIEDTVRIALPVIVPYQLAYYATYKMAGIQMGLPLPSKGEIAAQLVVYLMVEDFVSYWIHRLLHTEWGYDKIHRLHHELTTPTAFGTTYGHWAEFAIRLIEAIDIHSGYDFPFSPTKLIPFYGGAEFHDYHHQVRGRGSNFASVFTYCDYIYGTDKGYRYHKASLAKENNTNVAENNSKKGGNGKED